MKMYSIRRKTISNNNRFAYRCALEKLVHTPSLIKIYVLLNEIMPTHRETCVYVDYVCRTYLCKTILTPICSRIYVCRKPYTKRVSSTVTRMYIM